VPVSWNGRRPVKAPQWSLRGLGALFAPAGAATALCSPAVLRRDAAWWEEAARTACNPRLAALAAGTAAEYRAAADRYEEWLRWLGSAAGHPAPATVSLRPITES
jgi:hypothetical protein